MSGLARAPEASALRRSRLVYLTSDIGPAQSDPELMPLEPVPTQTFYTASWRMQTPVSWLRAFKAPDWRPN